MNDATLSRAGQLEIAKSRPAVNRQRSLTEKQREQQRETNRRSYATHKEQQREKQ